MSSDNGRGGAGKDGGESFLLLLVDTRGVDVKLLWTCV
jgi:hypothetical protein